MFLDRPVPNILLSHLIYVFLYLMNNQMHIEKIALSFENNKWIRMHISAYSPNKKKRLREYIQCTYLIL